MYRFSQNTGGKGRGKGLQAQIKEVWDDENE
jgi:hypothetical protein